MTALCKFSLVTLKLIPEILSVTFMELTKL